MHSPQVLKRVWLGSVIRSHFYCSAGLINQNALSRDATAGGLNSPPTGLSAAGASARAQMSRTTTAPPEILDASSGSAARSIVATIGCIGSLLSRTNAQEPFG